MTRQFIFILFMSFFLTSCSPTIGHQHELELAIADNFVTPTSDFDTLLLEPSKAEFTGKATKEMEDKVFNSRIDSGIYLSIFAKHVNKPIVIWTDEKNEAVYNNVMKGKTDYALEYKQWRLFFAKRLVMTLDGKINNKNSVNITATFKNTNAMWTIEKQFNYMNDKWTSKAVSTGSVPLSGDIRETLEL